MYKPLKLVPGLTPKTAHQLGYIWWKDSIFDLEAPEDVNAEFLSLEQKGYVFGEAATPDS